MSAYEANLMQTFSIYNTPSPHHHHKFKSNGRVYSMFKCRIATGGEKEFFKVWEQWGN